MPRSVVDCGGRSLVMVEPPWHTSVFSHSLLMQLVVRDGIEHWQHKQHLCTFALANSDIRKTNWMRSTSSLALFGFLVIHCWLLIKSHQRTQSQNSQHQHYESSRKFKICAKTSIGQSWRLVGYSLLSPPPPGERQGGGGGHSTRRN